MLLTLGATQQLLTAHARPSTCAGQQPALLYKAEPATAPRTTLLPTRMSPPNTGSRHTVAISLCMCTPQLAPPTTRTPPPAMSQAGRTPHAAALP
mmetsp:Transcript_17223/g.43240  ORF Transcript_17223/g.43240 Transcript_17223/m.43240 type:complete len:95 (+) Transcript_17223:183-467(+)